MPKHPVSLYDRLFRYVRKTDSCWLWTGAKISTGYGLIRIDGSGRLVHRVAWELHTGEPVPLKLCVLHRCDTPLCVNPDHLFVGSRADNVHDMDAKGRRVNNQPRGEWAANSKLTESEVIRIRQMFSNGESRRAIADTFDIALPTVHQIVRRLTWRHVA